MLYRFSAADHVHQGSRDGQTWQPLYGTTTVINEVYPPPLAWYGSAKALELFGFISSKKEPNDLRRKTLAEEGLAKLDALLSDELRLDKYMKFLDECYKNHDAYKKARGKAGTDKHADIEKYITACMKENGGRPLPCTDGTHIRAFATWAAENVDHFVWSEANCFSEKLWCGGITDFGFVHKNGQLVIGDAKPAVYPKHFIQTAAYGIYIKENGLFKPDGSDYSAEVGDIRQIDAYCIWDYEKGVARYLGGNFVPLMEKTFVHTVEMYKHKDLIGNPTL